MINQLFSRKSISELLPEGAHTLKRVLDAGDLIMLAIGAVIGAGIFSSIGTAAAGEVLPSGEVVRYGAGPALIFSFILLGFDPRIRRRQHCGGDCVERLLLVAAVGIRIVAAALVDAWLPHRAPQQRCRGAWTAADRPARCRNSDSRQHPRGADRHGDYVAALHRRARERTREQRHGGGQAAGARL